MVLACQENLVLGVFASAAFLLLGLVTFILHRRLREPADDAASGPNLAATAAIALAVLAALLYGLAWIVPTEAESGVRRTIADACLIGTFLYAFGVGPGLGASGVQRVRTQGQKSRALIGFFIGNAGLAWFVAVLAACSVIGDCFGE
jgi:hypothetical protein